MLIGVSAFLSYLKLTSQTSVPPDQPPPNNPSLRPQTLAELVRLSAQEVAQCDIARMNLLCATGLPGSEAVEIDPELQSLDQWISRIASETDRHLYRFRQRPAEFDNSEGFFRLLMMAVVLAEDFQVHYNPVRAAGPDQVSAHDGFFADSKDIFLHGLLGPSRAGTCSSIPVLYVALGRRLGYPVHLVTTKGHLFVRWESATERFNVEATQHGLNHYDDDYFKKWPFPITDEEIKANGYLQSLRPPEELAVFLSIRSQCLAEAGRLAEATGAYAESARLAPKVALYRALHENTHRRCFAPSQPHQLTLTPCSQPSRDAPPPDSLVQLGWDAQATPSANPNQQINEKP